MSFKVFNGILGRLHGNFQQYYPYSCVAPNFLAHFSKSIALKLDGRQCRNILIT